MHFRRLTTPLVALAASLTIAMAPSSALGDDHPSGLLNPETDEPGLEVGDQAPDLTLPSAEGEMIDLSELYEDGPIVVTFYRGGWCPYCERGLSAWAGRDDDLARLGARFVAISPETKKHAMETAEETGAEYLALVDPDGEAMREFRVAFELDQKTKERYQGYGIELGSWNASGRWELPVPATYIIDRDGVVQWAFAKYDYEKRADPDEVLAELRRIASSR